MTREHEDKAALRRLTWLDLVLIAALPVAAFGIGDWVAKGLAERAFGKPDPEILHDVEHEVPRYQESLAEIEARQQAVRARIATERVAMLERVTSLRTVSSEERHNLEAKARAGENLI